MFVHLYILTHIRHMCSCACFTFYYNYIALIVRVASLYNNTNVQTPPKTCIQMHPFKSVFVRLLCKVMMVSRLC